jgi:threonine dehydrogenase-like Zn-dependent dehydrogenase
VFGQTAAIFGAGPIGVLVAMVAREAGASRIAISDINEHRLRRVRELGFHAVDARLENSAELMKSHFGEEGADVSFEVAASPHSLDAAIRVAKIRGVVLAGGMFKKPPTIDLQQVTMREQTVVGTRVYNFDDFAAALRLLERPDFPVESLVSRVVRVEDAIEQGFMAIRSGEDLMKVLIRFDDDNL